MAKSKPKSGFIRGFKEGFKESLTTEIIKGFSTNSFFSNIRDIVNDELAAHVPKLVEDAVENPTGSFVEITRTINTKLIDIQKTTKNIHADTKYIRMKIDKLEKKNDSWNPLEALLRGGAGRSKGPSRRGGSPSKSGKLPGIGGKLLGIARFLGPIGGALFAGDLIVSLDEHLTERERIRNLPLNDQRQYRREQAEYMENQAADIRRKIENGTYSGNIATSKEKEAARYERLADSWSDMSSISEINKERIRSTNTLAGPIKGIANLPGIANQVQQNRWNTDMEAVDPPLPRVIQDNSSVTMEERDRVANEKFAHTVGINPFQHNPFSPFKYDEPSSTYEGYNPLSGNNTGKNYIPTGTDILRGSKEGINIIPQGTNVFGGNQTGNISDREVGNMINKALEKSKKMLVGTISDPGSELDGMKIRILGVSPNGSMYSFTFLDGRYVGKNHIIGIRMVRDLSWVPLKQSSSVISLDNPVKLASGGSLLSGLPIVNASYAPGGGLDSGGGLTPTISIGNAPRRGGSSGGESYKPAVEESKPPRLATFKLGNTTATAMVDGSGNIIPDRNSVITGGMTLGMIQGQISPGKDHQSTAHRLMRGLMSRGFTREQAAAIVGNLDAESTFNPAIVNKIGAVGLMQWLGARKKGLMAYAKSIGKNWQDEDVQLDWIKMERSGESVKFGGSNEKRFFDKAFQSDNVEQMAHDFGKFVERPSAKELAGSLDRRRNTALSTYAYEPPIGKTDVKPFDFKPPTEVQQTTSTGGKFAPRNRVVQSQAEVARTRKGAIAPELDNLLNYTANEISNKYGVDIEFDVTSGGQRMPGAPGHTGTHEHDHGGAADFNMYIKNPDGTRRLLDPRKEADREYISNVTQTFAAAGGRSVGASYMNDPTKFHFGISRNNPAAYAGPKWFKESFNAGRNAFKNNPIDPEKELQFMALSAMNNEETSRRLAQLKTPKPLSSVASTYGSPDLKTLTERLDTLEKIVEETAVKPEKEKTVAEATPSVVPKEMTPSQVTAKRARLGVQVEPYL